MLRDALRIDKLIIELVQTYRVPQLDIIFLLISWSVVLAFFISVLYLIKKKEIQKSFTFIATTVVTYVTVIIIKNIIGRWRPNMSEALSFPSMHTTLAFLFAFYLPVKRKYKIMLILWAALVAFSRMWLNLHYFSDVLAGAALGIAIIYCLYLKNRIKKKFHLRDSIRNFFNPLSEFRTKKKIKKKSAK